MYRFNSIPLKIPKTDYRTRTNKSKILIDSQNILNSQNNLEKDQRS